MNKNKIVGQTKAAGFQIGVRKTFSVSVGIAWDFLFSDEGLKIWLGQINASKLERNASYATKEGIEGEIRVLKSYSHIRLTWKPKQWENTSALQLRVIDQNDNTTISFHQDKLLDSNQREEAKNYWEKVLGEIGNKLNLI